VVRGYPFLEYVLLWCDGCCFVCIILFYVLCGSYSNILVHLGSCNIGLDVSNHGHCTAHYADLVEKVLGR
jgi:hypothetical protein